ncbi:MAG: aspartate kinase [Clostridia bacterium]
MNIVVKKFGGNTLNKKNSKQLLLNIIKTSLDNHDFPVIVVSALGRIENPYSTDSLLSILEEYKVVVNEREKDLLMSCGEIIASVVVSGILNELEIETEVLTGAQAGILTNGDHGNAKVISIETNKINDLINKKIIPIITGFQGVSETGNITTLGRGGSDISAIAIGAAIDANKVEIYTDVNGIYTADPRLVSNANLLKSISYTELFQMASHGSKVVHPRAVELAMSNNLPLYVCNIEDHFEGTVVTKEQIQYLENAKPKVITAISHEPDLVQAYYPKITQKDSEKLYKALAENGVSLDLINITSEGHYFIINSAQVINVKKISDSLNIKYKFKHDVTKVSCVGLGMHRQPGVFSRIISTLVGNNIEVIQTTDSHMNITCLIDSDKLILALEALHKEFFTTQLEKEDA